MLKWRESDEFKRGHAAELAVADWLKRRDCYVIPSYDYAGEDGDKAPKLQGLWKGYPVPDLDVSKNGDRFWVEVKSKASAVLFRKTGDLRHGIELRLLEHYITVQAISGSPCWLFIYEEDTSWLLSQSLRTLGKPVDVGSDGRGKKIAFWNRPQFRQLEQLAAGE